MKRTFHDSKDGPVPCTMSSFQVKLGFTLLIRSVREMVEAGGWVLVLSIMTEEVPAGLGPQQSE